MYVLEIQKKNCKKKINMNPQEIGNKKNERQDTRSSSYIASDGDTVLIQQLPRPLPPGAQSRQDLYFRSPLAKARGLNCRIEDDKWLLFFIRGASLRLTRLHYICIYLHLPRWAFGIRGVCRQKKAKVRRMSRLYRTILFGRLKKLWRRCE